MLSRLAAEAEEAEEVVLQQELFVPEVVVVEEEHMFGNYFGPLIWGQQNLFRLVREEQGELVVPQVALFLVGLEELLLSEQLY